MAPVAQNPSPMVEETRAHERVADEPWEGVCHKIMGVVEREVEVYAPAELPADFDLWIHFHGAAFVVRYALKEAAQPLVGVAVNMGVGSAAYEGPFASAGVLMKLLGAIGARVGAWNRLYLSGFSAGYGALRAILSDPAMADLVDGVLVLDGLHTGYKPDARPLEEGGVLEEGELAPFLSFSQRARAGEKAMLLTHSEVFPGTFASTTETANYLVKKIGLPRRPVLAWGALGMQQLSDAQEGRLRVMGYAGNSAPDHMDHLHALFYFSSLLSQL